VLSAVGLQVEVSQGYMAEASLCSPVTGWKVSAEVGWTAVDIASCFDHSKDRTGKEV